MQLDPQYWSDLAEDEHTIVCVGHFVGFIDISEEIKDRDDADKTRDEHAALLPRALVGLRQLALLREGNTTALRSIQASRGGRNQPCPCGSGSKFKRSNVAAAQIKRRNQCRVASAPTKVTLEIPHERAGTFDRKLTTKYQYRFRPVTTSGVKMPR